VRNADLSRLLRYGVSGLASAATQYGVLVLLVEGFQVWPVGASTAGFVASIVVSYVLQRTWVFRSAAGHVATGARFLAVTAVAFALNAGILWCGTELLSAAYPVAQAVALVTIPVVNYTLNSLWTFNDRVPATGVRRAGAPAD